MYMYYWLLSFFLIFRSFKWHIQKGHVLIIHYSLVFWEPCTVIGSHPERFDRPAWQRKEEGGSEGGRITKHTHTLVHVQVLICTYMYYSCANLLHSSDVDKHLVDGEAIYTWIHARVTKQQSLGNLNTPRQLFEDICTDSPRPAPFPILSYFDNSGSEWASVVTSVLHALLLQLLQVSVN